MARIFHTLSGRGIGFRGSICVIIMAWLSFGWATAFSAEPTSKTFLVGTKVTPPFVMKKDDGTWYGISVDLWRQIAKELGIEFEWRELNLEDMLKGVETGSIDAAVGALTITAAREERMDFTHPFFRTGLGIAVPNPGKGFLTVVTILALTFFGIGFAMWFSDRIRHQRSNRATREIRTGLFLVALVVIVSSLIAHTITFVNLNAKQIKAPEDLEHFVVATVPGSTSETYLRDHGIRYQGFPSLLKALQAVSDGGIDTTLYDTALLRYLVKMQFNREITVLPMTLEMQEYGIALTSGSALRESVNQHLIAIIQNPAWQTLIDRYLASSVKQMHQARSR